MFKKGGQTGARSSKRSSYEQRRDDANVEIRRQCFPDFFDIIIMNRGGAKRVFFPFGTASLR